MHDQRSPLLLCCLMNIVPPTLLIQQHGCGWQGDSRVAEKRYCRECQCKAHSNSKPPFNCLTVFTICTSLGDISSWFRRHWVRVCVLHILGDTHWPSCHAYCVCVCVSCRDGWAFMWNQLKQPYVKLICPTA